MNEAQSTSPLDQFVNSLLESTAQLMLVLDHMQRYPSDSAAAPIDETLRKLVSSVLKPEFDAATLPSSLPPWRCSQRPVT